MQGIIGRISIAVRDYFVKTGRDPVNIYLGFSEVKELRKLLEYTSDSRKYEDQVLGMKLHIVWKYTELRVTQ